MTTDGIGERKAALRREAKARRDALPTARRIEASFAMAEHALAVLAFDAGTVISAYLPIGSEVDPRPLMAALADRRARLAVPAIVAGDLEFRELLRDGVLEPQGFGTHAPGEGAAKLDPAIMLVPMLAFDRKRARIGYGKGFYDRAIARLSLIHPRLVTVGLAFAAQEAPAVPTDAQDRRLDLVITESEVLAPSASASEPERR
ncbi:5-formyltetrahydrofolate cyclo-ligase [Aureimonas sp. AU12]|uniref:5-formyltetrahydrofolate cyclo-ligase n=1 Tax=Aureimonas sp. AU12 TaxID=1638161 RepID=UPI000780B52D|nr:5-formyltetrahydrofolate cyclo-ligase [Aureimonas sp. AU12]